MPLVPAILVAVVLCIGAWLASLPARRPNGA